MKGADKYFLSIILLILVAGLIALGSASGALSQKAYGTPYRFLWKQLVYGVGTGSILFFAAFFIPISLYKKYAAPILICSLLLLVLVFIPALGGASLKGAARWIHVGPFSFQPSEVVKLALVIYLAAWMAAKKKDISTFMHGFLPFLIILGVISIFLINEPDIGTLGVVAVTSLALFFMGGGRAAQIFAGIILGIILLLILVKIAGYRQDRITVFLNTWQGKEVNLQDEGYQINQALIAIGSGGFMGKGLGMSRQKFSYLPEPAGDAIFAVVAEEFGFFGSVIVLGLFFAFFVHGMMISARAKDHFSQLLAGGIIFLVVVQVIINIGALSGLLPLTGIPLPFISYGGTALAFLLFEMGIVLQISKFKS
ncbi:MAG: putative lipid II flippase FtsW [Patescibacteria group bacterium]